MSILIRGATILRGNLEVRRADMLIDAGVTTTIEQLIFSGTFAREFVVKTDRAPAECAALRGQTIEVGWHARDCLAFGE